MAACWEDGCSFGLRCVSWYEYLIVSLVFSHLGFWSGNLFLIAPFPDLCLLVPFSHRLIMDSDFFQHFGNGTGTGSIGKKCLILPSIGKIGDIYLQNGKIS